MQMELHKDLQMQMQMQISGFSRRRRRDRGHLNRVGALYAKINDYFL